MASETNLPRCCGECARWMPCDYNANHGYCDNWAGVKLAKDAVCVPNMGVKKEVRDGE